MRAEELGSATSVGVPDLTGFQEIGSGGFSNVYSANEADAGRRVAVKVLRAMDETGRRRFDRERLVLGKTTEHPNIVTMFRSGYTDPGNHPYLVMEYMGGGSLQDKLDRGTPPPVGQAIELIIQIAEALGFAHEIGILHRDVKPANILLSDTGTAKLTDFGIANFRDATGTDEMGFSLAYTPPETFAASVGSDGKPSDPRDERSDIYSLAATLYSLITRAPAFAGPTQAQMIHRILTAPPPSVGRADLDGLFATALAKDPNDRFSTAADFAEALRAIADPPATSGPPGPQRTPSLEPGKPAVVSGGLSASSAAATNQQLPPPPRPTPQPATIGGPWTPTPQSGTSSLAAASAGGTTGSGRQAGRQGRSYRAAVGLLLALIAATAAGGLLLMRSDSSGDEAQRAADSTSDRGSEAITPDQPAPDVGNAQAADDIVAANDVAATEDGSTPTVVVNDIAVVAETQDGQPSPERGLSGVESTAGSTAQSTAPSTTEQDPAASPSTVNGATTAQTPGAATRLPGPPTNVSVTIDGPDVVIRWAPPTGGHDGEYATRIGPVGDSPDFRRSFYRYRNDVRSERIENVPEGTYDVFVWARGLLGDGEQVVRRITVSEQAPIQISDLVVAPLPPESGASQPLVTLQTNKCAYVSISGDVAQQKSGFTDNNCYTNHRLALVPVGPGDYNITVTVTDRLGISASQPVTFTIDGSTPTPCQVVGIPNPWRVEIGETAVLRPQLEGDCGAITWDQGAAAFPIGFTFDEGVVTAKLTGQPRGERFDFLAHPARSASVVVEVNVVAFSDAQPNPVPCTIGIDQSLRVNGELTLVVPIGTTQTTRVSADGDCGSNPWANRPLPRGVTFANDVLTVVATAPAETLTFTLALDLEAGTNWGQPVRVYITE